MSNFLKTLRIGFAIFRGLCLLLFLSGVALQFSSIQTYVLNTFVMDKNHSIQIKGSSGFFPFYFSLEKVSLFSGTQEFLKVNDLELNWSILELLRYKTVAIHTLKVGLLEYKEIDDQSLVKYTNKDLSTIQLPKIPFGYIQNINISKATYLASKKQFNYTLLGKTEHKESGVDFDLKLTNLTTNKEILSAAVKYNFATASNPATLGLDIKASEEKGIIEYWAPSLKGSVNLTIKGQGTVNDFQGAIAANFGKTFSFIADITTELDPDKKHIVLLTKQTYKNQTEQIVVSGKVRTTKSLDKFELHDWKAISGKSAPITITGSIHRSGDTFSTKDLTFVAPLSKTQTVNATLMSNMRYAPFMAEGLLKGSLTGKNNSFIDMEIPFSMKDTLESIKVSLKGKGNIPDLPKEYAQFSEYMISAKLTPKSAATLPTVTFTLEANDQSNLSGTLALKNEPELTVEGQLLANNLKMDAIYKNGSWNITGHTHPLTHQNWFVQTFKAQVTPSKKMPFDAQAVVNLADKDIDLELKGEFDTAQQLLELVSLRAVHKESFIEGKGFFDFSRQEGDLNWHLYTFNIGDLLAEESASGTASVLGQLSVDSKDCILTFSGDFHKLILTRVAANSGNLSGSVQLSKGRNIQLSFTARKASTSNTVIEDFSLNTNGTLDDFSTTVVMSGFSGQAFKSNLAFSVANLSTLNVDTASLNLGSNRIFLEKPASIQYTGLSGWTTKTPVIINVNKGRINLSGNISESALTLSADLTKVSSDVLSTLSNGAYFLKGDMDGKLNIQGANANPSLNFDLKTSGPLYSTHLLGSLENNLLQTTFDINSDQLNMRLNGVYPTKLKIAPFSLELDQSQPFETQITAHGTLDNLHHIFDFNYDRVSGDVDADITFFGYLSQQSSKGFINVTNGGYERQNIGLNFKGINLKFVSNKGSLMLSEPVSFKDHKNNNGKILVAKLSLGSNLIPVLSTEISSDNLQIIDISQSRRGGMSASYSGTLKADGPVSSLKIFTRGSLSSFEKYIGELDDVPIFEVNEIHQNLPLSAPLLTTASDTRNISKMTYDIDLSLERSFHIFGQGLDSAWTGRLIIEGTSDALIYKGQFKLKDGQLRVLDRFFDIQRGEIFFDGNLSPRLYIESNLNLNDMRVKIILEGDSTNLQKRIVSDSDLSEQEVLQKLFFNRSSTISQSFQALNYIAASSFISSFINIGFYQQEDPITHAEREFISLHQRFTKRTYSKVDVAINNIDSDTSRVSVAVGIQPTPKTKAEVTFSPDKGRIGAGFEWGYDF